MRRHGGGSYGGLPGDLGCGVGPIIAGLLLYAAIIACGLGALTFALSRIGRSEGAAPLMPSLCLCSVLSVSPAMRRGSGELIIR